MQTTPEPLDVTQTGVGIAGAGNVAQALGALLGKAGVPVRAIAGRDRARTERAAAFTAAERVCAIPELGRCASVLLLAVTDDALGEVAGELAAGELTARVVLHTCGSRGPEVLAPLAERGCATGVLHPLQTIPSAERGVASIPGCRCAYCGDALAADCARQLIARAGAIPLALPAGQWALYHAAAVLSINFHVALVDASLELWESAGISRQEGLAALAPIVRASVENVLEHGPEVALTGPIRRGDATTVERHLGAIASAPREIRALYVAGARRTLSLARRAGLPEGAARRVRRVLENADSRHMEHGA